MELVILKLPTDFLQNSSYKIGDKEILSNTFKEFRITLLLGQKDHVIRK